MGTSLVEKNIFFTAVIYMNPIALFAAAIYNIYNIYLEKERFNGLYDSERSSGKMGNYSTPGTGALRTGENTGRCSVWGYLAIPKDAVKPRMAGIKKFNISLKQKSYHVIRLSHEAKFD